MRVRYLPIGKLSTISLLACARAAQVGNHDIEAAASERMDASGHVVVHEQRAAWRVLFDGETTTGWRGYGRSDMPDGWQVVDGALTRMDRAGDIITEDEFENFELELEWKVAPGANSGIFYRVGAQEPSMAATAPEMQVLDDAGHADGGSLLTSAGSTYGVYAVSRRMAKPAGEWNAVRIVVDGNHVEQWLNGTKVVEFELGSADWTARVEQSVFRSAPLFGQLPRGHIGLQDHGDWVAFRNIRIRVLR